MISLVEKIPKICLPLAEVVKINCAYNTYRDVALFWVQNEDKAVISMLDGNMTIYNNDADIEELRSFINVINPQSVFSNADTITALFGNDFQRVFVMKSDYRFESEIPSDAVKSDEIYSLLNVQGLELPPFEYFVVDFCRRLNHGELKYFAIKDKCAAIAICDGHTVLVNGIASSKKGMGSLALRGLLSQYSATTIAVCQKEVMPFYLKNKFCYCYDAGYWRKNT